MWLETDNPRRLRILYYPFCWISTLAVAEKVIISQTAQNAQMQGSRNPEE
jgi:hypothetical protein